MILFLYAVVSEMTTNSIIDALAKEYEKLNIDPEEHEEKYKQKMELISGVYSYILVLHFNLW